MMPNADPYPFCDVAAMKALELLAMCHVCGKS